jgi:hypothetical protein
MTSLTIDIDNATRSRLQQAAGGEQTLEQAAADLLRRRLLLGRFHELCRESESLAEAAGYRDEDELLADLS